MSVTIEVWEWWNPDGTVEAVLPDGDVLFTTADRDYYRDEVGTTDMVIVGDSFQLEVDTGVGPMQLVPMTSALEDALQDVLADFVRDAT